MDLSEDEPKGDDDAAIFRVFVYNKYKKPLKFTHLSPIFTTSSLKYIQCLLNEPPTNELTDFLSNPVYTNAYITSGVANPERNLKVTSYISGASEVPFGTHVDVQATNIVLQEMFLDEAGHHISSPPANIQLEALTSIDISKAIGTVVHAKFLTEIKKLLPTHVPKVLANDVKPRLKNSVLEVMQNNQISLFTKPSTSADDLSKMDLKLKLLNRIHLNKTHPTNQNLYDTLYESIILDQEALYAQDTEPSFHKRSHDHQDLPTDCEGKKKKKRRNDAGQSSFKSSRKDKSPMVHDQEDTPADQPQDQENLYVQEHPNAGWFTKKSRSVDAAKRRTTWLDLLLKYDIDQNENHILGPSTVAIAKKLKELIQKDELIIADFDGARLEKLKQQYKNDVELEYLID
ncbi:hypothetical protein Tco_1080163 [Tanacetum coccineum]|uniref:Uncharacterized protein n=1 Tax=Tanacetum coccineum TaxID=301880 RepID=A0ABQ5HTZ0_9ASTR